MDKQRIKDEAEAFFEWPTLDKSHVSTTSMLMFAEAIAEMARSEEQERCARIAEGVRRTEERCWVHGSLYDTLRRETAAEIRRMPDNDEI